MTRVNAGIPPELLSDKLLLAEHREIKRIPNHLEKYGLRSLDDRPTVFTLGKGHVKFFIGLGLYTLKRYRRIYLECLKRGFAVSNYEDAWDIYQDKRYKQLFIDYKPGLRDYNLIRDRIIEKGQYFKPLDATTSNKYF